MSPLPLAEEIQEKNDFREGILLLPAAVFVLTSAIALSLSQEGFLNWRHLWAPVVWLLAVGPAHFFLRRTKPARDPFLLPLLSLLTGWGLVLLDRLAPNFLGRQVIWLLVGTAILLVIAILPRSLRILRRYRYSWLTGGLVLLAATLLFGVNPSGFGAALWLPVPFIGRVFFQPSELLKMLLVIFLASYFDERESLLRLEGHSGRFGPLPYLAPLLLMWGFCMVLLVWQRDLGAATLFFIVFLALLYLVTGDRRYVWSGLVLLLVASIFAYFAFDVVALRVDAWWNPWPEAGGRAFQIVQSLYALAAGGVTGQGVAEGFPIYIPVVHSDFVFAAIAEEWGLIGSFAIVACFTLLAHRGLRIAALAQRPFHMYLAAGITILFSAQAFLIMAGVTKLLPLTGVTLPFVSYGGSSMLVSSIMMGLLLYLSDKVEGTSSLWAPGDRVKAYHAQNKIQRLNQVIVAGFVAVALALVFWSVVRAPLILAREDNPRLVEAELRIQRGRILDRNGVVLAETVGPPDALTRVYPVPAIGPAVGYYSFRHGTAGVEESFDTILRGNSDNFWLDFTRRALHQPQVGQDVQLTLDSRLQQRADALLGNQTGAVILLGLSESAGQPEAKILALASHPGYDSNQLDERFDELAADESAPLLNRVTQGQYQPGLILQPFIIAEALDQDLIHLGEAVEEANRPVIVNDIVTRCSDKPPDAATWGDVLAYHCPGPMTDLANQLGVGGLDRVFTDFGLRSQPRLALNTATPVTEPILDPLLAGIGQESLTVTPLQVSLAWAALATDGRLPTPQLVTAVDSMNVERVGLNPADNRDDQDNVEETQNALASAQVAQTLRQVLPHHENIAGHSVRVLSGPAESMNGWYLGLAPVSSPRYVVVVVVESMTDFTAAEQVGQELLAAALES